MRILEKYVKVAAIDTEKCHSARIGIADQDLKPYKEKTVRVIVETVEA